LKSEKHLNFANSIFGVTNPESNFIFSPETPNNFY